MPLLDDDPFAPYLNDFLNRNYPTDIQGPGDFDEAHPEAIPPFSYYDRHIASNLILKAVKPAPWLPTMLAKLSDDSIAKFITEGHSFKTKGYPSQPYQDPPQLLSTKRVYEYYSSFIGEECLAYASKLLFHPNDPKWFSFLRGFISNTVPFQESFRLEGGMCSTDREETASGEKDFDIPRRVRKILPDWVIPTLVELDQRRSLANWECFVLTNQAETLLQRMGPITSFNWDCSATKGHLTGTPPPRPLDSSCTHLFLRNIQPPKPSRSKMNVISPKFSNKIQPSCTKRKRKIIAPTRIAQVRDRNYRPDVRHFLQRAWAKAVGDDITFIIFNCGRYERIGVRHRETQTLYLSDLIDPARCKNPAYGKMHLGLALAVVKDWLDRLHHMHHDKVSPSMSRPQASTKRTDIEHQPRADSISSPSDFDSSTKAIFDEELSKRELALLILDFDIFRSPFPASFLRIGSSCVPRHFQDSFCSLKRRAHYAAQDFLTMTATEPCIGRGATGIVYRVVTELELDSGIKIQRRLILKLAFWDDGKERMMQEYEVYKRLALAGVTQGIVSVHGLFQEMETGTLAMILDDVGKTLRAHSTEAGIQDLWEGIETTEAQRDAFINALNAIHKNRILHDDIRLDNLMIDQDGHAFIIDFDRGILDPSPRQCREEMYELLKLIGWPDYEYE